jgi:hypothetical protein
LLAWSVLSADDRGRSSPVYATESCLCLLAAVAGCGSCVRGELGQLSLALGAMLLRAPPLPPTSARRALLSVLPCVLLQLLPTVVRVRRRRKGKDNSTAGACSQLHGLESAEMAAAPVSERREREGERERERDRERYASEG